MQDSFEGSDQDVPAKDLDENWKAFNRVMILVYKPENEEDLKAVLGSDWDMEQNRRQALTESAVETQKNPNDVFAWFNLGTNYTYFEQYNEAVAAYNNARSLGWPQRMLRYQFGPFIAYFNTGQTEELVALASYALERTPNSEEAHLWLGWGEYRQNRSSAAKGHFEAAQKANSTYVDAEYGLAYLEQNP